MIVGVYMLSLVGGEAFRCEMKLLVALIGGRSYADN